MHNAISPATSEFVYSNADVAYREHKGDAVIQGRRYGTVLRVEVESGRAECISTAGECIYSHRDPLMAISWAGQYVSTRPEERIFLF